MGLSVQFTDAGQVLTAYENRDVEAWSLWCGKQFMFKGIGLNSLQNVISTLANGSTNATYTLKVYEGIEDDSLIKSNTPDDGSFNFRLNDEKQLIREGQIAGIYRNDEILNKLNLMEEKLAALEETEVEEKSGLGQILDHPAIAGVIPAIVELIVSAISGTPKQQPVLARPGNSIGAISDSDKKEVEKVIEALSAYDANILEHLKKLLEMAKTNNQLFNTLINSL